MKNTLLLVGFVLLLYGCGSTGGGSSSSATESRDVLTDQEIATTQATNAYDAIVIKRPWFLQSHGPRSLNQANAGETNEYPIVYLDKMYYGDLESLRQIPVQEISLIRYLDSNDATMQFGAGHTGGIILIITKPT